jgi:hypothetical protein
LAFKEKQENLLVGDNRGTNWGNFHVWPSSTSEVKRIASAHYEHLKEALPDSLLQCIQKSLQEPGSSSLILTVNDQNSETKAWNKYDVRAIDW